MSFSPRIAILAVLLSLLSFGQLSLAKGPTELRLHGYSVIPSPQKVSLQAEDIDFDATWAYRVGSIGPTHIAVRSLLNDLREFHAITLKPAVPSSDKHSPISPEPWELNSNTSSMQPPAKRAAPKHNF